MSWTADPLAPRRAEQERLVGVARTYVEELATRVSVIAAAVAGSVARGDFNVWSDVDVVVVSDDLPASLADRATLLGSGARGVEAHGFTTTEFRRALERGDRLARAAVSAGVALRGELGDV